jgi:hypothetical protein
LSGKIEQKLDTAVIAVPDLEQSFK